MNRIKVLDQNTIDRIAAGEVVERPASVAKELIENAFDSGADAVTVEIGGGGIDLIRVTDNGSGIEADDVRTAFLRHATSKLNSSDDLFMLQTLGFRGEALSSIGAVSRMELITRTKDSLTAVRYIYEGGNEISFEEVGAPVGTTVIMRNLFFNTPARAKFLRTPRSEGSEIASLVEHLSLSHPDVSVEFINNSASKLFTSGNGSLKETIFSIYGRELSLLMNEVEYSDGLLSISGYIGRPEAGRANRNYEMVFVNGRFVKDRIISSAAEEAYKGYLMQHRFPFMILNIEIDTRKVDVNVHPSKMALKFSDEMAVYDSVKTGIRAALEKGRRIPLINAPAPQDISWLIGGEGERDGIKSSDNISDNTPDSIIENTPENPSVNIPEKPANNEIPDVHEPAISEIDIRPADRTNEPARSSVKAEPFEKERSDKAEKTFKEHQQTLNDIIPDTVKETQAGYISSLKRNIRIIGQLFDTYILAEEGDELFIIDQHAAHEKVMYEKFMRSLSDNEFYSQMLMPARIVCLSPSQQAVFNSRKDILAGLGFEIEEFGGREYRITAVPFHFYGADPEELFIDILDNEPASGRETEDIAREKIIMRSCKAAVKANMKLSDMEIRALIDELFSLEDPYRCPHGRPAVIKMSHYELDKKFKRIV